MTAPLDASNSADWAEWLRTKKWDLWATGTFAWPTSEEAAARNAVLWLRTLHSAKPSIYGTPSTRPVYAVYAVEWGQLLGGVHVHLLVGGVGAHPKLLSKAKQFWSAGHMLVERYDPRQDPPGNPRSGACAYIVKHPEAVTIVGTFRDYRPRIGDR